MSTESEKLLIRCGLPQYTGKLIASNMITYQSIHAKRDLLAALIPNKEHVTRILTALGNKGSAAHTEAVSSTDSGPVDEVESSLIEWEKQLRQRLRLLSERQASNLMTKISIRGANGARPSTLSRQGQHELMAKVEHCKTLLAATHSGQKAHRKFAELTKLLTKYKNRAGDPREVDTVMDQLKDHGAYVRRVLVMLQEESKLHTVFPTDGSPECDDEGDVDAELNRFTKYADPNPNEVPRPPSAGRASQRPQSSGGSALAPSTSTHPLCVKFQGLPPPIRIAQLEKLVDCLTRDAEALSRQSAAQVWEAAVLIDGTTAAARGFHRLADTESDARRRIEAEHHDTLLDAILSKERGKLHSGGDATVMVLMVPPTDPAQ